MSDKPKEKKPSDTELAKKSIAAQYKNKYNETPIIISVNIPKIIGGYAAVTKEHVELFTYDKTLKEATSIGTYRFDSYESVSVDHFALKSVFEFKGTGGPFTFIPTDKGKDIELLIRTSTPLEVTKLERKWYQKILGFRSDKKWKMIVASAAYLFIVVAVVSVFMDKKEEKVASSQVSQTNNEPAKKSSALDHASKETSSKPKDTAIKMDDGRNVNMEIYNKYNVKYQSHEPTTKDKDTMEHFEKMAEKYSMSVPEYISKEKEIVAANVQKEKEAKQKADEENKQRAGASKPTISKDEFNRIENGMTYDQVKEIIGSDGEVMSEGGDKGTEYYTVMYMWKGEGSPGANANFMFQGGKLNNKAQFGLK
ncbi:hypothetical protein PDQ30_26855 [Bacillus cereus group sp. Bc065]|uniref:hypothetical protein n=1 Tax=Bacillus cereus group sp. Bc065 TaxID=3018115 RepID=UPI0022E27D03|nr:hypothetical protein [Bacillus cereus group sp. Bc065]MDA2593848.1 hypothetical protein [Bacillus cereus group sp. Bc065]